MLRVEGAVVGFAGHVAVDHVDLEVTDGETVAVLGPSGCGKTTLLRAIAGLQPLDDGVITWDGADLAPVPPHQRRFGLMFQEYALFPHRDVRGNVEFGLRMIGAAAEARRTSVDAILDVVGLRDLAARRVGTLSGGEQQRVALARALVVEPRLLMLDEPLGALDRAWRVRLMAEIRVVLDAASVSALYVTHDHTEAFAMATRVAVMRAGRIVQQGAPAAVWRRPADAWTASFLGFGPAAACAVHDGHVQTPWGSWPAPLGAPEGPAELVLRPDAVRVDPAGALEAAVTRVAFTGANVDVSAQPEDAEPVTFTVAAHDAPAVGARVRLSFDPDGLLLYPPD